MVTLINNNNINVSNDNIRLKHTVYDEILAREMSCKIVRHSCCYDYLCIYFLSL